VVKRFALSALVVAVFAVTPGGSKTNAQGAAPSHPLLPTCAACHGGDGNSVIPGTPSLAGQPKVFIETQLVMIREGLRPVPQMEGMLDKVKDEDFVLFAKYFSELPVKGPGKVADPEKAKRGEAISKGANCASCHMPDFAGREQMPRLAGQREDFLLANMKQFRDGKATGRDTIMAATVRGMSDAQLGDLAHYLSSFGAK
jgi:cytochrome c553